MIFELWCLVTGGHRWTAPNMAGVSLCDRCGALHFGPPQIPWEAIAAVLVAEVKAGRMILPKTAVKQGQIGLWERNG